MSLQEEHYIDLGPIENWSDDGGFEVGSGTESGKIDQSPNTSPKPLSAQSDGLMAYFAKVDWGQLRDAWIAVQRASLNPNSERAKRAQYIDLAHILVFVEKVSTLYNKAIAFSRMSEFKTAV